MENTEPEKIPSLVQYNYHMDETELIRKYFTWDSPKLPKLFLQLGAYGLPLADIANILGISMPELHTKLEEHPNAKDAYICGPSLGKAQATAKLFDNVMRGRSQDIQFYLKAHMPEVYGNTVTVKGDKENPLANIKIDITTLALQHVPTHYLEELVYANRSNAGTDTIRITAQEGEQVAELVPRDGANKA